MKIGEYYLVRIYLDFITDRIVASARPDKFLDNVPPDYQFNQEVEILIAAKTDLGYKVIINNLHWGLLYENEIFGKIHTGLKCKGYVKRVREDEKIDISLYPLGYSKTDETANKILSELEKNNGYLPLNDKTDAEKIYAVFACSKKSFKQAIGALYKKRVISIENDGIRILNQK
jgi:predicted RNA-binding protein (virulence factor B family)